LYKDFKEYGKANSYFTNALKYYKKIKLRPEIDRIAETAETDAIKKCSIENRQMRLIK